MMAGVIRDLDGLGRIVIPMEYRKAYHWPEGTEFEITVENNAIVCRPFSNRNNCALCGADVEEHPPALQFEGRVICGPCIDVVTKFGTRRRPLVGAGTDR